MLHLLSVKFGTHHVGCDLMRTRTLDHRYSHGHNDMILYFSPPYARSTMATDRQRQNCAVCADALRQLKVSSTPLQLPQYLSLPPLHLLKRPYEPQ